MIQYKVSELAKILNAEVIGDEDLLIDGVSKIEEAGSTEVTFISNPAYLKFLKSTSAGAVIISEIPAEFEKPGNISFLRVEDAYAAFLHSLNLFHPEETKPEPGVHPSATVHNSANIDSSCYIGPQCVIEANVTIGAGTILKGMVFIGNNVSIGENCLFHSRVSVREHCEIGNSVIIQDGAVIGSDGFGFTPGEEQYTKIPQVGKVIIEDYVEIGANTTIDRATLGVTKIKQGAKLDNLIQIAHNVEVGENSVLAAQVGIAGSTKTGKWSMFGGQVGINGHIKLSDNLKVAAKTGVSSDPGEGQIIAGYPAQEIGKWRRSMAILKKLPELAKKIKDLEKKLESRED